MPSLKFQPEADRYYAEGYWRDGDLWTDFARRAEASPQKPALILEDRTFTFDQLRRAAAGVSVRLAEGVCKRWELTGEDIYLVVCEFGFVGGLVFGYFPPLFNGATGVLVNRWNAKNALRLIEAHKCTYVLSMPTHSADLIEAKLQSDLELPSMRVLAAPGLTRERRITMREAFGVPPLGDYGLSEVPGHAAHGLHETDAKIALTEGRPYDGTEIRIVDDKE